MTPKKPARKKAPSKGSLRQVGLDYRVGSAELVSLLPEGLAGIVDLGLAGDIRIAAETPTGPGYIRAERKKLLDYVGSLRSGRLYDQLSNMIDTGPHAVYLILEGGYYPDHSDPIHSASHRALNSFQLSVIAV